MARLKGNRRWRIVVDLSTACRTPDYGCGRARDSSGGRVHLDRRWMSGTRQSWPTVCGGRATITETGPGLCAGEHDELVRPASWTWRRRARATQLVDLSCRLHNSG